MNGRLLTKGEHGMSKKEKSDKLSAEEAEQRLKAALRGSRKVGHKPMEAVSPRKKKKPKEPKGSSCASGGTSRLKFKFAPS